MNSITITSITRGTYQSTVGICRVDDSTGARDGFEDMIVQHDSSTPSPDDAADIDAAVAAIQAAEDAALPQKMFTVSIRNKGGDPSDLQSFATLAEAQAFAERERSRASDEPDAKRCGWEWTISDNEGACYHTTPTP